jgi:holo-[acyl-carrier protein] synthase
LKILSGVDMVAVHRIEKSILTLGDAFKSKIFSEREILYCESKKRGKFESYAARFAGKEAVTKLLGTGIAKGISFLDLEIFHDVSGSPKVLLLHEAKNRGLALGISEISISLSHCKDYAIAHAVAISTLQNGCEDGGF